MSQLLPGLLLAGLLGLIGQGIRSVVGLKGMADDEANPNVAVPEKFSAARLLVSLLIGFIAGSLAGIGLGLDTLTATTLPNKDQLLGLMAAGYAGTDFIEGFVAKYLPGPSTQSGTGMTPRATLAAAFQNSDTSLLAVPTAVPLAVGAFPAPQAIPSSDRVKAACEAEWDINKSDCNAFVRAVAQNLGATLSGDANQITAALQAGAPWQQLADGPSAAAAAGEGKFVVGGLNGQDQVKPNVHGHVVVVVAGTLNRGKYPHAYWGSLGGTPAKDQTINWAWSEIDRDKVVYAAYEP